MFGVYLVGVVFFDIAVKPSKIIGPFFGRKFLSKGNHEGRNAMLC